MAITALLLPTLSSAAEPATVGFDIPAQSLAGALTRFSAATGLQVLYDGDLAQNIGAPALKGNYSAEQALRKLLQGSGLNYRFSNGNTVTLEKAAVAAPQSANTMPAITVTGRNVYDSTDPYNTAYTVANSSTALKTDAPLMETPVNVQIIPKAVLNDQQAITIDTALKNVSGVMTGEGSGGLSDDIYMRGFRTSVIYRNGYRFDNQFASWGKREMANVERIEVVKGSAAVMYGQMEPGGMVNVVTKQPLATSYYAAQQQFGSYGLYRTTVDANTPLTSDDTLLFRFNGAYESAGSFRDLVNSERIFLAPILKWNISDRTQATLEMEYRHDNLINDTQAWPYVNGQFINMPKSRNLMEATPQNIDDIFLGANWSHEFNDDWKISNRFAMERMSTPNNLAMRPNSADGKLLNGTTLPRVVFGQPTDINTYFTTLDLTGHFDTFGLEHTVLFGGDYYNFRNSSRAYNSVNVPAIDVYAPMHSGLIYPTTYSNRLTETDYYGLYGQDQIKLPFGFSVVGGLRYQYINQAVKHRNLDYAYSAVTPRVGVVWQAQNWLSLYGNYVENFGANNGLGQGGNVLPPQSAQQWETGIKMEFFDGKASANFGYFDLTKQNVATADPNNPNSPFQVAIGEVHSNGPEVDLRGEFLPGWNAIATYANLNAIVTKDYSGIEGNHLFAVPRNMGSLWNTYEFQSTDLKGLKIGGGLNFRDESFNYDNSYKTSGYITVDLMTSYNIKLNKSKITLQLNVNNLLNKTYFQDVITSLDANSQVNIGMPRSLLGSVKVEF
ncbi:TonB-dependent siderophore receptor [Methylomonas methanica]|uniref:TonB-dependent siderophore receptor n=1 Tax=Methylomonas methanica TaxID=421 RepID=UPI001EE63CBB|nr:TonB-dependent receptor [Methylomonas methanica]